MMDAKVYVVPTNADVLCGRGQKPFRHEGNRRLRREVVLNLDQYINSGRGGKTAIVHDAIVSVMRERGRFLIFDRSVGKWYDGGLEAAKNRVGSAFRDASIPGKVKCVKAMQSSIQSTRTTNTRSSSPMELNSLLKSGLDQEEQESRSAASYSLFEPSLTMSDSVEGLPVLFSIDCFDVSPHDEDEVSLSTARSLLQALGCGSDDDSNSSGNMLNEIEDIGDISKANENSLRLLEEMSRELFEL